MSEDISRRVMTFNDIATKYLHQLVATCGVTPPCMGCGGPTKFADSHTIELMPDRSAVITTTCGECHAQRVAAVVATMAEFGEDGLRVTHSRMMGAVGIDPTAPDPSKMS